MLRHGIAKTVLAALLVAAASPSTAAEPPPPPVAKAKKQTKQAPSADANGMICKKVRLTGSRLAKNTCATEAEWKELEEEGYRD